MCLLLAVGVFLFITMVIMLIIDPWEALKFIAIHALVVVFLSLIFGLAFIFNYLGVPY